MPSPSPSYSRRQKIRSSSVRHRTSLKFSCPQCSSSFNSIKALNGHKRTHGPRSKSMAEGKKEIRCPQCNMAFRTLSGLYGHKKAHAKSSEGTHDFPCPHCSKICDSRAALNGHQRMHKRTAVVQGASSRTSTSPIQCLKEEMRKLKVRMAKSEASAAKVKRTVLGLERIMGCRLMDNPVWEGLIEDNNLYEKAMQERDEFKRVIASGDV